MFRYSLVFLVGLCASSSVSAATWADAMFSELSKDFGSVPRGPMLTHPFHLTNKTAENLHIASVRVSCGCTSATAMENELAPGQSTVIVAQMDTRRFSGVKTVTIFVQFDRPRWEEVRLWVQANSRDDVMLTPESVAFGQVKRGSTPSASVTVAFLGNGQCQVSDARCDSNYIRTGLQELHRTESEVAYQVVARIRPDTPVGKWYTDIWLTTNDPSTPRVRVPVTVDIESALSVSPTGVAWGKVKLGDESVRKIIIRGAQPFRIIKVKGTDDVLSVRDSTQEARAVHVLTVSLKAALPGIVDRTLQVITDLEDEGEIEFQARAQIVR